MRSWSCCSLVRGLIPFRRTFSCICKPFDLIRSLTQSISSRDVEILSSDLASPTMPWFWEDGDDGHEQEDNEDDMMKKISADNEAVRNRTGIVTTMPFCIAEEEKDDRTAINVQISVSLRIFILKRDKPAETGFNRLICVIPT